MISIIIPCYNAQDYLFECFESIKNQTYQDYELIFINDGSTDGTLEVLNSIQAAYPHFNLKVYTQSNQGVSLTRNRGIQLAQGQYLTFVDADDYLYPQFLETLLDGMKHSDLSVVGIGGDGYKATSTPFEGLIFKDRFIHEFWLTQHLWGSTCNKLYRRDLIVEHAILFNPSITIMEDMLFNLTYCQWIDSIYVSNKLLYFYRLNHQSAMHTSFSAKNLTVINTFQEILQLPLNQKDKQIIELHEVNSLLWLLRVLYKTQNQEQIYTHEKFILSKLKQSNRLLFFLKGWQKGVARYGAFLLYFLHPSLYKGAIQLIYRFKPS